MSSPEHNTESRLANPLRNSHPALGAAARPFGFPEWNPDKIAVPLFPGSIR